MWKYRLAGSACAVVGLLFLFSAMLAARNCFFTFMLQDVNGIFVTFIASCVLLACAFSSFLLAFGLFSIRSIDTDTTIIKGVH